jgi:hypothetical protein
VLLAPSGTISNPTPTYTWSASSGATEYRLEVGDGAVLNMQGVYPAASVCSGSTCAVQSVALAAGAHWWNVQARNVIGGT